MGRLRQGEDAGSATIRARLERLDWPAIEASLLECGHVTTPRVLSRDECTELVASYPDDRRFRKRIDMERYRFGLGDYSYFREPLPRLVRELRSNAYRRLAPIANRMAQELRESRCFPPSLNAFRQLCRRHGQAQPTPLLLRYREGGYNCLHRDLYGELAFPLQLSCVLSRPGVDYEGGEFLLVDQRPRSQAVGIALTPAQGELVIFATAQHPSPGRRGSVRATMRHGVSRITRGSRYTLGVIFHDAKS
jgi:hypothetical protein